MTEKDKDRPQLLEELRFAKKQQWAVATAVVTLLAAAFALQHSGAPDGLSTKEKVIFAVVITFTATFGCVLLSMLQGHIRNTRRRVDADDKDAAFRGVSIVGVLIGVVILSALGVLYFVTIR